MLKPFYQLAGIESLHDKLEFDTPDGPVEMYRAKVGELDGIRGSGTVLCAVCSKPYRETDGAFVRGRFYCYRWHYDEKAKELL